MRKLERCPTGKSSWKMVSPSRRPGIPAGSQVQERRDEDRQRGLLDQRPKVFGPSGPRQTFDHRPYGPRDRLRCRHDEPAAAAAQVLAASEAEEPDVSTCSEHPSVADHAERLRGVLDDQDAVRLAEGPEPRRVGRDAEQVDRQGAQHVGTDERTQPIVVVVERAATDIARDRLQSRLHDRRRHRVAGVGRQNDLPTPRERRQRREDQRERRLSRRDGEDFPRAEAVGHLPEEPRRSTPWPDRGLPRRTQQVASGYAVPDRRHGPLDLHGMYLTMRGPICRVTPRGRRFQSSMASWYFGFFGLTWGSAPPFLSQ